MADRLRPIPQPMRPTTADPLRIRPVCLLLPVILLHAETAGALALGKLTVLSPLGKRFSAEVQVLDTAGDATRVAQCFRLGSGVDPEIPTLERARLTFEERGGRLRLQIVSDQVIHEPVLQVNLRQGCGSESGRNYIVLIDPAGVRLAAPPIRPPVVRQGVAPHSSAAETTTVTQPRRWRVGKKQAVRDTARARSSGQARAPARLARDLQATHPDLDQGLDSRKRLPADVVLNVPSGRPPLRSARAPVDAPTTPPAAVTTTKPTVADRKTDRLIISAGAETETKESDAPLALSSASRLAAKRTGRISEEQRAALRQEYQLLTSLDQQTEQQLAVAENVRRLEATVSELQAKIDQQRRAIAMAEPTAATAAVLPATTRPLATARVQSPTVGEQIGEWWFEILVFICLTGIVSWLFRQRATKAKPAAAADQPSVVATLPASRDLPPSVGSWHLQKPSPGEGSALGGDSVAALSRLPDGGLPAAPENANDEVTSVLELAEIMTSFGRTAGAADALKEFLDQRPTAAVAPWLKLLEVYRRSEEREAFEITGLKLKHHFNVAPPAWESAGQLLAAPTAALAHTQFSAEQMLARLPSLRQLPHIASELSRTWDTPECPAYLHRLLRDNRGGERQGFQLATVRELLLVIELQESRLARLP